MPFNKPTLISDKGTENINKEVESLEGDIFFEHLIAQTDIYFSNSLIESFFHQLKNRHLYYQEIKSTDDFKKQTDFYVLEHNEKNPFAALNGATPVEAYRDKSSVIQDKKLVIQHLQEARRIRIKHNQSLICKAC